MKYTDDLFHLSDFPAFTTEQAAWEQRLVDETERDQRKAFNNITTYGLYLHGCASAECTSPS